MAFIQAEIKSYALMRTVPVRLYFPTDLPPIVGNTVKGVITLLHGMGNTGADWTTMSAACRYAADNGYVLVIPDADNSFYLDLRYGAPFYTLLTEELPARLGEIFRLPTEREKNYIAGLSMGGYGALLLGLRHPERYAAIGSFSGTVDMEMMLGGVRSDPFFGPMFAPLFGDEMELPKNADLIALAREATALPSTQQPRILLTCGEQDDAPIPVLTQNKRFHAALKECGLPHTLRTWQGVHEWNFWDRSLAEFIGFIQNSDYALRKQADWNTPAHDHD